MMGCKLAVNVVHPAENFLRKFSPKRLRSKSLEQTDMTGECTDDIFPIDLTPTDKVL